MKSFVLLLNGELGIRVLNYILNQNDVEIEGVILNSIKKRTPGYRDQVVSLLQEFRRDIPVVTYEEDIENNFEVRVLFQKSEYGISALFGHVLPKILIEKIECGIINLHPSLLPIGRGADPIPWSIISKQKQGVTVHIINSGLDTGPILSQKEIESDIGMNAGEIYQIAVNALIKELETIFPLWIDRRLKIVEQSPISHSIKKSEDLERIRISRSNELGTFEEFLRKLQALTFADGRRPMYLDDEGMLWKIEVSVIGDGKKNQEDN